MLKFIFHADPIQRLGDAAKETGLVVVGEVLLEPPNAHFLLDKAKYNAFAAGILLSVAIHGDCSFYTARKTCNTAKKYY